MHDGSGGYTADLIVSFEAQSGAIAPMRISGVNIFAIGPLGSRAISTCRLGPLTSVGPNIVDFSGDADTITAAPAFAARTFFLPAGTWHLTVISGIEDAWFASVISLVLDGVNIYTYPGGGGDPPGTNWIPLSGSLAGVNGNRNITVSMNKAPIWGGPVRFTIIGIRQ